MYSAMKMIANTPLLYSVLNPETSSLSPSAKSNGVRFNSANTEMIHIVNLTKKNIKKNSFWNWLNFKNFIEKIIVILLIIIKIKDTSYEIVWARARILPRRE